MVFLAGFLLGMALQLSIGPVCLAVLYESATRGFREALKMVWGVALVDGIYILASFLGMATLLGIAAVKTATLIAGSLVLIVFGARLLIPAAGQEAGPAGERNRSFGYGIALTLTNPLTIIFWSSLFGSMIASGKLHGAANTLLYSLGCVSATVFFLSLVAASGNRLSAVLNERRIRLLNLAVGLFLIGFGISMLLPIYKNHLSIPIIQWFLPTFSRL